MGLSAETIPAKGTLGIMGVGMGSVFSTLVNMTTAANEGLYLPVGSLTQMDKIRVGERDNYVPIKEFVELHSINRVAFGGWDVTGRNLYEAAVKAQVVNLGLVEHFKNVLGEIRPMPGIFDPAFIDSEELQRSATHTKTGNKMDLSEQVRADIQRFLTSNRLDRGVMIFCASTETTPPVSAEHQDIQSFERGLKENSPHISPSMIYAYAALKEGVPFVNGTPGLAVDIPAMVQLAEETGVPIAGKDFKTGQTFIKTALAPGLAKKRWKILGWHSHNVLGNNDGLALKGAGSNKSKIDSKGSVLEDSMDPNLFPELYSGLEHTVDIGFFGAVGDNKQAWDLIVVEGPLGEKMQIQIYFGCKDSILAAPVVLDLALYMDFAKRSGLRGIQEWLGLYFKSPQTPAGLQPVHNFYQQVEKLENNLRHLKGVDLITHLGYPDQEDLSQMPADLQADVIIERHMERMLDELAQRVNLTAETSRSLLAEALKDYQPGGDRYNPIISRLQRKASE